MQGKLFRMLCLLAVLSLLAMACSFTGGQQDPTPVPPTDEPAVQVDEPVEEPTEAPEEPEPTEAPDLSEGQATDLNSARNAVIRIVAEGSYEYPDFTSAQQMGSGSGFVISPDGIAVTNNHVVTGAARIKVFFSDNDKAYNARILGVSECSDLAVIDIEGEGFPYLSWYDEKPEIGLTVYSMGYPLGDPNFTRHEGAISKEGTSGNTSWTAVDTVLEHDAIINPGNSGGPLVTEDGQVVGVNYAGASEFDQYYAIPADAARDVVEELQSGNDVASIGINGEALVADDGSFSGIWVYSVASGSPADKSGIQAGDFITEMEGISLGREGVMTDYCDVLRTHNADDTLSVQLIRFSTGEVLEGQLNGREMAVVETFDPNSGGENGGTETGGEAPAFFTEEFDGDLSNWTYFYFGDSENDFGLTTDDSSLVFDITGEDTYVYVTYDPYTYADVRLDALVANEASNNNNNFSLICRYDPDKGWYEFNVTSGGLWNILRFDEDTDEWTQLYNGGSTNVNMGQDSNVFSMECTGNEISVFINDKLVKTVRDTRISEGQVGISVSAFNQVPVTMRFDTLVVSEP